MFLFLRAARARLFGCCCLICAYHNINTSRAMYFLFVLAHVFCFLALRRVGFCWCFFFAVSCDIIAASGKGAVHMKGGKGKGNACCPLFWWRGFGSVLSG